MADNNKRPLLHRLSSLRTWIGGALILSAAAWSALESAE